MRDQLPERLEDGRVQSGHFASRPGERYGAFFIMGPCGAELKIISSGESHEGSEEWEHVSVSTLRRCPNWQEMCFVKNLFWDEQECVVQYHPAKADYVNMHPFVLHLWRPVGQPFPMPPKWMV